MGWRVAIIDYSESGNDTAYEIGGSFYKADIRSWKQQFDAFEQIKAKYSRIDFGMPLVNLLPVVSYLN